MASYQELLSYFQQHVPGAVAALQTPQGGDVFNKWAGDIMADLKVSSWDEIPVAELDNYDYVGPVTQDARPAEQVIGDTIGPGLIKQIEGDAARQAEAERLGAQTTQDFSGLRSTLDLANVTVDPATGQLTSPLLTSQNANVNAAQTAENAAATTAANQQLTALNTAVSTMQGNLSAAGVQKAAALQQQISALQANLGTMTAAQKQALADQVAALTAAQGPMNEARLNAAEGLVTAVNIGLEQTKDQLKAEAARDGFVGGSTMQDAALAREVVGARQQGANIVGSAKLANASDMRDIATYGANTGYSIADAFAHDTRTIGDYGATTGYTDTTRGIEGDLSLKNSLAGGQYDIATSLSNQQQDAANRATAARLGYGDAAYGSAVNAGQIRTGLGAAEAAAKTALIPYGTAGTNAALGTLNWFSNPANPPDTTAVITNPSTAGTSMANLGSSLVGSAFRFGDLYKPAATKPPKTSTDIWWHGGDVGD